MTVVLLVVLVLMFVRLKQFTRQNNNNTQKKKSPISITKPGFFIFIYYSYFSSANASLMRRIDSTIFSSLVA